jgi:predicted Fe-Mo cluster-binding NifX family protein
MRIAIGASGNTPESQVDPRFGRAARFILWDTTAGEFQVIDNTQSSDAAQGAGIHAAETVARQNVDVVITGHCGPKAYRTLQAAGIQVVTGAGGTVAGAIDDFLMGRIKPSEVPDVMGHW